MKGINNFGIISGLARAGMNKSQISNPPVDAFQRIAHRYRCYLCIRMRGLSRRGINCVVARQYAVVAQRDPPRTRRASPDLTENAFHLVVADPGVGEAFAHAYDIDCRTVCIQSGKPSSTSGHDK